MNRRNFVVGLGTVATISGVASVTAASFANDISSTADFRVVVDEELTFERGEDFETDAEEFDADLEGAIEGDDSDFEDAVDDDNPIAVFVNDGENENVETALAVLNDPDVGEVTLEGIYQITNDGSVDQDINILFDFGEDVTDGDVDEQTVLDLFAFEHQDTEEQISPDSADEDGEQEQPTEELTVEPGETEFIDLVIDLDEAAEDIGDAAGVDPFDADEEETLDLVDAIEVGTDLDIDDE